MYAMTLLVALLGTAAAAPAYLTPAQIKEMDQVADLWGKANADWQAGRRDEAARGWRVALAGAERLLGDDTRWVPTIINNLAAAEYQRNNYEAAAALGRRHAWTLARTHGAGHWKAVDARQSWRVYEDLARQPPAGRDAIRKALALGEEARAHQSAGRDAEAMPLLRMQLEATRPLLWDGLPNPNYVSALNNLASMYRELGEHATALPLSLKALDLYRRSLGARHPGHAIGLINHANLLLQMGQARAAIPFMAEALSIRKEVFGGEHAEYAQALSGMGLLRAQTGDHRAALALYTQALAIRRAAPGARGRDSAPILNNLAALHKDLGQHEAAIRLFKEVVAVVREAHGERHPEHARCLNNLATAYSEIGDFKSALPLYEKALAINKAALGERHPHYTATLASLAAVRTSLGDTRAALALLQKALATTKATLGLKHPAYAHQLNHLASWHLQTGDRGAALPLFEQVLALRTEAFGERHPRVADSLGVLAALHRARGDKEAALPLYDKALAVTLDLLDADAATRSDRQQAEASEAARPLLWGRLALPDPPGSTPAAAHALAFKGAVLARQQQRRLFVRLSADPATREAAESLQEATRQLATLRLAPTASRARLEGLGRKQEAAQAELSRLSADFRAQRGRGRLTPEAIAASLPEGVALIDYVAHGSYHTAFVYRKGRPPARVPLGSHLPAREAIARWRPQLVNGLPDGRAGAALKRVIWAPLERHLDGVRVVLVSPEGLLATVPFAALPGRKSGGRLIEDVALAVIPFPQAVPALLAPRDKGRHAPTLLVAGDLAYGPPAGGPRRFAPLEATRAEADAVKASFARRFPAAAVTDLRGAAASKRAVQAALSSVRYAHLATHGYSTAPQGGTRQPLLLSGLALSGANRDPQGGEDEGVLTALEVSESDLTRLELAVLSACETGLGVSAGGEGMLGMLRAFQMAGCRSVVSSLWNVDDAATRDLMAGLYAAAWDAKTPLPLVEALRRAQLAMLNAKVVGGEVRGVGLKAEVIKEMARGARVPPYYWAGFVLSGDWR